MPNIKRYTPDFMYGLTNEQVSKREKDSLNNINTSVSTKTIPKIIKDNLFTLFNLINFILAISIIYVGSYKNLFFMGVVISNLIISTFQEIRAKKSVDKLSILSHSKITTIREGKTQQINIENLVLDDIIELHQGNQVPADCKIILGECDVNESLLTGESDSISKKSGDMLLSGSYLVSGKCKAKIEHVGKNNYAYKISNDAKYVKKINSQIMLTFNKIILILSFLIIPVGLFLFFHNIGRYSFEESITTTTGALIGMIPEGLVLLTSTVLAISVIRLTKQKVLVQDLYCIEALARVDVLCLDKTGTITEGTMKVNEIIPYKNISKEEIINGLLYIVNNLNDVNPTYMAIKDYVKNNKNSKNNIKNKSSNTVPFSSERKWSGVFIDGIGSYIMGSAEFIFNKNINYIKDFISQYNKENRVIILAHSKNNFINKNLPDDIEILGLILIKDVIRSSAKETLNYFYNENVDIKIISGDNVETVSNIAKQAGVKNYDKFIDARDLKDYKNISEAVKKFTIFGRVTPVQKKQIICALKEQGHTVAMTGDGVNDVLALKEADCSVVMANGSDAARNVSQLVLLNSDFSSMPKIVLEGRRSINNIQRSSSLFLVKTIYSTLLAILFLFFNIPYPFIPIQSTLTSVLTIGVPSFILALEPNKDRVKGNFFLNIISKALPCSLTIIVSILLITMSFMFFTIKEMSTLCVILTGYCGLMLLYKLCVPFNLTRKILISTMSILFVTCISFFKDLFSLSNLSLKLCLFAVILCLFAIYVYKFMESLTKSYTEKNAN